MAATELTFNKVGAWYESEPVEVAGDFALHLEFAESQNNTIMVGRSVTGDNFTFPIRTDYDEPVFDFTFAGGIDGLSIQVKTRNEPTVAQIL